MADLDGAGVVGLGKVLSMTRTTNEPESFSTQDLLCAVQLEASPGRYRGKPTLAVFVDDEVDPMLFDRDYIFGLLKNWGSKITMAPGSEVAEEYKEGLGRLLGLGFDTLADGRRVVSVHVDSELRAGIPLEFLLLPLL